MRKIGFPRLPQMCFFTWIILAALLAGCGPDANEGPELTGAAAFYKGKHLRWIIPYSPGGGYDEYARLIAPYLERHTGARVDIVNTPGAGGMRGANELFHSPKDGLTIGMINGSALVINEIAEIKGAAYKVSELEYLARIVADKRVFVVSKDSGYDSIADVLKAGGEAKIGATGLGGSTYVDAVITNEAFALNLHIIHGFDSSSVIKQAMLRGNIVGTWGSWGSAVDAIDQGSSKVVLQSGRNRLPELADVPTTFELVDQTVNPERTRAILEAWESLHEVGRPVAAPPGTPADRLVFLSDAFDKAMHEPELLAVASGQGRPLDYASASEIRSLVLRSTMMNDEVRGLFVKAVNGQL